MKLADLERALKAEIDNGRLGEPVALRIHAVARWDKDLLDGLGNFRPLLILMGDISSGHVHARRHSSLQQCAILWTTDTGKSVLLTLGRSRSAKQSLHLLLIGNHGMTQLQGGEDWSDVFSPNAPSLWEKEIQESLRRGTSIPLKAS